MLYELIEATTPDSLNEMVNQKLAQGWKLLGGTWSVLAEGELRFLQAVTL